MTTLPLRNGAIVASDTPGRWRRSGVLLSLLVASVWICFGLYFKLLDGVPRHRQIVQSMPLLGGERGAVAVRLIGMGEILIAAWIISGRRPRMCAALQTALVLTMNGLELTFAKSHLLSPAGLIPINIVFLTTAWIAAELRTAEPFYWLRRHPFPVDAFFEHSLVLTYALPEATLRPMLPPGLKLDTYRGYGFVAVAMVKTRQLRPRGFPPALGQDFTLAGYRIFATLKHAGRTRRGLYILRSDATGRAVVWLGNLLTHYQYRRCRAAWKLEKDRLTVAIQTPDASADVQATADLSDAAPALPPESIFETIHDALRFAGPMPWTFDYETTTHSIVMIKGERQAWSPRLINVEVATASFMTRGAFAGTLPILCSVFHVNDIPYRWRRGVRVALDCEAR